MFCFPGLFVCNYIKLAKSILSPALKKREWRDILKNYDFAGAGFRRKAAQLYKFI